MRVSSLVRYAALAAVFAFAGCSCEQETLQPVRAGSCEPTYACPAGFEYRLGDCHTARCQVDTDCCPGQKCNAAAGFCADQISSCTADKDCAMQPGTACIDFRGARSCGFPNKGNVLSPQKTQGCNSNDDCDAGRSCFGHRCVTQAPCMGGCPSGSGCDVDSNTCFALATCTSTCTGGQIAVIADPDNMSGAHCCKVACKCETLPPVKAGQIGWYARVAVTTDEVLVSCYDNTYGDLVVAHFDQMGNKKSLQYVDGYPTSGPVVGDPNGPRAGHAEPGPDVGQYTSIVTDAMGTTHVAYHDKTSGTLRYANNAGGKWNTSVVDAQGNVGLYTSIAIGKDGAPRIAYMMAEGTVPPDPVKRTGLKLATAHSNMPMAAADWRTEVIDSRIKPEPPCGGGCMPGTACVQLMTGVDPVCAPSGVGCGACMAAEACVTTTGTIAKCKTKVSIVGSDDFIEGTGLFTSLAFTSTGTPVIAYYDRLDRQLMLVRGNGAAGWSTPLAIDGAVPMHKRDVGQHASLAIGPGDLIAVAYFDATSDDLVYLEVKTTTLARSIADNGVTPPNLRMVGADASLLFDEQGRPAIAYQDPTNIDLLYARRTGMPPMWSNEVLRGAPPPGMTMMRGTASGFYASQARKGNTAFISNVDVTFDADSNLILNLKLLTKRLD